MVARLGHGGGVNCVLSYKDPFSQKTRAYRLRCVKLAHGVTMVATEGKSRTGRAFYPHQRTSAQFMLTFALLGRRSVTEHAEYERFNVWLREYMRTLLDLEIDNPPAMLIEISTRRFRRQGVPLGPVTFGEHVGSMVWYQTVTFETTFEPNDTKFKQSTFDFNGTDKDRNARFFYPRSPQLSGNQKPVTYDGVNVAPNTVAVEPAALGTVPNPTDVQTAVFGIPPEVAAAANVQAIASAALGIPFGEV